MHSYPEDKRPNKKLTNAVQIYILNLIVSESRLYLREIQNRVLSFTGLDISPTVLCKFFE